MSDNNKKISFLQDFAMGQDENVEKRISQAKNEDEKKPIETPKKEEKVIEKKKELKTKPNVAVDTEFNISINEVLEKGFSDYKDAFVISNNNIRLTEDNHNALKKLKATDVSMVHLVNFLIHSLVKNPEYSKFLNKNI